MNISSDPRIMDTIRPLKIDLSAISMEAIKFQTSPAFYRDLVAVCRDIQVAGQADTSKSGREKMFKESRLADVFKKHTKMNITPIYTTMTLAAIRLPTVSNQHIFLGEWRGTGGANENVKDTLKDIEGIVAGTVDFEKGRVGGVYAKAKTETYLSPALFWQKWKGELLSPEEIAAVIMHEVGHAFTTFEFTNRFLACNIILNAMTEDLLGTDPQVIAERFNVVASSRAWTERMDHDNKLNLKDKDVLTAIVLKNEVEKCRSELGCNVYDRRMAEQLADQFAIRQGAGQHLGTALDKITSGTLTGYLINKGPQWLLLAVDVASMIAYIMSLGLNGPGTAILQIFLGSWVTSLSASTNFQHSGPYDDPKERFNKMRKELIASLKDSEGLTSTQIRDTLEAIEVMDKLFKSTNSNKTLVHFVYDTLMPYRRREISNIELQQMIEENANNTLFASAAKIKTSGAS